MAIKNKIGVPVTGENFFGRARELSSAHRYLHECQSLLLSAPRRIGKSSLAKRLIADMTSEGWKCVYIDLQGTATTEEFLHNLIDAFTGVGIMEKTGKKVKDFLHYAFHATEALQLRGLKIDMSHPGQLELTYHRLAETFDYTKDTLIVIDELPLFLGKLMDEGSENRRDVEFLLSWFRSIRQKEDSLLRWFFCGSVGLRNFTNHHRISQTINDLVEFKLGEMPTDEAIGLIKALACSYNLVIDDEIIFKILDLIQWPIPYFVQLLMDRLIAQSRDKATNTVSFENVEQAIDELSRSNYFMTWDERLVEYRELESMARAILNNLTTVENGLSKDQLLQIVMTRRESSDTYHTNLALIKVLEMLEHDGYIIRTDTVRKFRSPLLRKWWKHKFLG